MKALSRSLLSLLAGLATAFVLVMLVTFGGSLLLVPGFPEDLMAPPTPAYLVVNLIGSCLAAACGGYVAARLAGRGALAHATVLGLLLLGMTVASGGEPAPGQPTWYPLTVAVLAVLGAVGGGVIRSRAGTAG